ncbi:MAG TPA: glycosyltransferase family 2 protein [Candidatus Bathyarchaeia archaeon]|nr:glycosyltransferase family 2 protein [Candidatus Bathyarchaeia archaeon]
MKESETQLSIIILNYNNKGVLGHCLDSLAGTLTENTEVVVVDNASSDDSCGFVKQSYPWVRLIQNNSNHGYSRGNNIGATEAKGSILVFLNNDVIAFKPNWLSTIVRLFSEDSRMGIAGPLLLQSDRIHIDSAGGSITYPLGLAPPNKQGSKLDPGALGSIKVAYVSGAALIVSKDLFERLHGFDPSYFAFHEEVDLCWRARAIGYKVVCAQSSQLIHLGSATYGSYSPLKEYLKERNRLITNMKNYGRKALASWLINEMAFGATLAMAAAISKKARRTFPSYVLALLSFIRRFGNTLEARKVAQSYKTINEQEILALHQKESIADTMISAFRRGL